MDWLKELSNEKLIKRLVHANFNFSMSCINGSPNYKEQDKATMYEKELLRRLEKTQ